MAAVSLLCEKIHRGGVRKGELVMNHEELAVQNFMSGYNCAQSVFLAFAPDFGMDRDAAARLSSSFGGGMGRLREVCGALSGIFLAAGALYGYDVIGDDTIKMEHYALIQSLAAKFKEEHGTILCRELIGRSGPEDPRPEPRTQAYYDHRACAKYVATAARLLEEYMAEHPPKAR